MIVGIDASRANEEKKTGVGWYTYHLLKQLQSIVPEDVQVVLYSPQPLQEELAPLPLNWENRVLSWFLPRWWTQGRLSWEMWRRPPDVLFIPAHVFPWWHPRRTVMTVHDIAAWHFPQTYSNFERWYSVASARYAQKKLFRVIVPSQSTKEEMLAAFGQQGQERIRVIPHGFDQEQFSLAVVSQTSSSLGKYQLTKPFLLSLGRLEEKKNTVNLIKAFDLLKEKYDWQLLLVGSGGWGKEKVAEAIENSQFKKDIFAPGWVPAADLPGLLATCQNFVFPSLSEGFGLPILEAMACGASVVASPLSVLQELGQGAVWYMADTSAEAIVQAIEASLSQPEERAKKIQLGLERVKDFTWEKCASATWSVLVS
ncbi:MAG TPA: glycosyltransferase family 1 protein [Patescibacteria group bacterium]|nr:glycosyltransferase family 1 protein [Patescibacteria group bacterium]